MIRNSLRYFSANIILQWDIFLHFRKNNSLVLHQSIKLWTFLYQFFQWFLSALLSFVNTNKMICFYSNKFCEPKSKNFLQNKHNSNTLVNDDVVIIGLEINCNHIINIWWIQQSLDDNNLLLKFLLAIIYFN